MTDLIQRVEEITGFGDLAGRADQRGEWITWDQIGSAGIMRDRVKRLKAAGIPAFYSAADRRWGVKQGDRS